MAPPAKNAHAPATSTTDDVQTLRRLTREAFGEITSLRDRLGDLERSVATDRASRVTDAARVDARVTMGGVALGDHRAAAAADVDVAPRAVTTIDAPLPGGDSLVVRLASSSSSSSSSDADPTTVALEKVMYRHRIGSRGWLRISPIGGEGQDAAATLNPLSKGGALTSFGARGPSTLSRCEGAAACASYDFGDGLFGVSGGVFDRDGGEGDDGRQRQRERRERRREDEDEDADAAGVAPGDGATGDARRRLARRRRVLAFAFAVVVVVRARGERPVRGRGRDVSRRVGVERRRRLGRRRDETARGGRRLARVGRRVRRCGRGLGSREIGSAVRGVREVGRRESTGDPRGRRAEGWGHGEVVRVVRVQGGSSVLLVTRSLDALSVLFGNDENF